jgi:PRTRC genetic system protein A
MTRPVGYLINSSAGIEGETGVFYDYILAAGGVYLRARNQFLAATVCIAPCEIRELAPLKEDIQLLKGKIPLHLLNLALSVLIAKPDIEQYLAITWDGNYRLKTPAQQATAVSVTYETLPDAVLEIHSHTGEVPAHFSPIDNRDEQGLCLYAVVADMRNLCPSVELRLGICGYFLTLSQSEVFI